MYPSVNKAQCRSNMAGGLQPPEEEDTHCAFATGGVIFVLQDVDLQVGKVGKVRVQAFHLRRVLQWFVYMLGECRFCRISGYSTATSTLNIFNGKAKMLLRTDLMCATRFVSASSSLYCSMDSRLWVWKHSDGHSVDTKYVRLCRRC